MNDFERRDEQFDDQVQIEHLDLSDTCQERKRYRVFQLLGCFGQTHRWGRRGILSGGLISFLILLSLLVFSNALPLSSPQKHLPLLPSPLVSPPTPLEVVAATGQVVYVANKADDSLNALEAQTGIMRWRFHYAVPLKAPCQVVDALLYCTAFQEQVGRVYAIQLQNGNALWSQPLPAGAYPFLLAVVDQIVYVTVQQTATQQSGIIALRADDGTLLWQYQQELATPNIFVSDGIVYLNTSDGALLVALQATTGRLLWRAPPNEAYWFLTSVDGRTYTKSEQGSIAALQSRTGSLIWHYQSASSNAPLVAGECVYLSAADGTLVALRARDGSLLWQNKHVTTLGGIVSLAGGLLYVSASDGTVYALRALDGSLLWQYHLSSLPDQQMIVVNDQLYLHTRDGYLSALQARTGLLLWRSHVGPLSASQTTIQVAKQEVYMMAQDGTLYALLVRTGSLLWSTPDIIEQPLFVDDLIYVSLQNDTLSALLSSTGATRWSFSDRV
jgi:outer membrane protein assembly factor BamB